GGSQLGEVLFDEVELFGLDVFSGLVNLELEGLRGDLPLRHCAPTRLQLVSERGLELVRQSHRDFHRGRRPRSVTSSSSSPPSSPLPSPASCRAALIARAAL